MSTKLRIKMGQIEVEYEGDESFLKKDFADFLTAIVALQKESGENMSDEPGQPKPGQAGPPSGVGASSPLKGTTSTIAAKLGVKTGSDLIIASCARLTFVTNKESFSRKEIAHEMKSASAYFKKNYIDNMTSYLRRLIKASKLIEQSADHYALPARARAELRKKLV